MTNLANTWTQWQITSSFSAWPTQPRASSKSKRSTSGFRRCKNSLKTEREKRMASPECLISSANILSGGASLWNPRRKLFGFLSILLLLTIVPAISTRAQHAEPGDIPPPAKVISKAEQAQLDAQSDVKKRTKLALDLMNARLTKAESLHDNHDLDAMFVELGVFHALVDHTLEFLNKSDKD